MSFSNARHLSLGGKDAVRLEIDGGAVWKGLPSGYKQIDYIEVTGTQFIDTEFIPDQDTRFVSELMMRTTSGNQSVYGSRQNANSDGGASRNFAFRVISGDWQACYGVNLKRTGVPADTKKFHIIDHNKNVCRIYGIDSYDEAELTPTTTVVDGVAINVIDEQTFTSPHSLLIGAIRSGSSYPGTLYYTKARYRGCQLYDNGVLIRDFIPCKDADGNIGMYDTVNAKFHGNAGTGTFVAGDEI